MKNSFTFTRRTGLLLVPALALLLAAFPPSFVRAQESSSSYEFESGETLVLSPFEVTSGEDRGYVSASSRPVGPRFQTNNSAAVPTVPVTLIRRADAVVIEFALSNSADKQEIRNQELTASVDAIAAGLKAIPGLRFENREVQLASGNRTRSIIGKGGVVTSFANFAVYAEISDDVRLYERVKQVRALVSGTRMKGDTKIIDGPVALFLKRPNDNRAELLAKIFADLETVKKGLGADFEVLVTGLSGPVHLRSCSESEVELWLDYSFTIRSLREMESRRPLKA
jgi:hypothetical protein